MNTQVGVGQTERGWELTFAYNDGPAAFGPEEESDVYETEALAWEAAKLCVAEHNAWNRRGLADAPHMDAV